ncbi:hypothetical protein HID58_083401 [Brassica napus]|uniref:Uncharacterized protein n=1 Tax=Brassica napus TaxID=3708 RepID=A0ABQ7YGE3_BRANA|nr:hypothetical protein HID58_083401 [Brassica napus]
MPNKRATLLPTVCTNVQHPETRVKARVSHLLPALQRRGDGLPPSAELKPMKKDAQTEPSSRSEMNRLLIRKEETDEAEERESIGKEKNETPVKRNWDNPDEKPPSTPRRRDAESKTGDTDLRKTPHPRVKSQQFSSEEESDNAGDESRPK